jgi:hypothetical protein
MERFIARRSETKSQLNRPRGYRRILCSDPAIIEPWFELVANVKAKYGILDEDTYNFDETGFRIGVGGLSRLSLHQRFDSIQSGARLVIVSG